MMLRTILLIIGVFIILSIAIDGWRRKRRQARFSRAVEPTMNSAARTASFEHALDTVSAARVISTAPIIKNPTETSSPLIPSAAAPISTRQQLEFPELTAGESAAPATATVTVSEAAEPVIVTKRDPRDIAIDTVKTTASANDISSSRPAFRPEQVKSANQVLPARERAPERVEKVPEVIALTVMSISNKPFIGYDLIRALEANNLHFGDMNIYHRHKYRNGKGPLYFSVASVTRPGTLDPKNLSVLSTPGLCLFMRLDNPKHDRIIFKQMLSTAHDLAKALNGAVCDERRVPLRESTIQGYNEKLNL